MAFDLENRLCAFSSATSVFFAKSRRASEERRSQGHPLICQLSAKARDSSVAFVLSHFEARDLLILEKRSATMPVLVHGSFSVDIGMRSLSQLVVMPEGISTDDLSDEASPPRVLATWSELRKMSKKGRAGAFECYRDGEFAPSKIADISQETNRAASLHPCAPRRPPTMILGGFGMHRFKDSDPASDTAAKLDAIGAPYLHGNVLDICTGLGYTAIAAARLGSVQQVVTIELDPVVILMQQRNPWSQDLFVNSKIDLRQGDASVILKSLPDEHFSFVIHDPPAQAMGGELYGLQFYKEINRVCRRGARLFHYVGDPASNESGKLYKGTMMRLQEAGFRDVQKEESAYGVTACLM